MTVNFAVSPQDHVCRKFGSSVACELTPVTLTYIFSVLASPQMASADELRMQCIRAQWDVEYLIDRLAYLEFELDGLVRRCQYLLPFMGAWQRPWPEWIVNILLDFLGANFPVDHWSMYPPTPIRAEDPVLPHDDGHYMVDVILADLSYEPRATNDYWRLKVKLSTLDETKASLTRRIEDLRPRVETWARFRIIIMEEMFPPPDTESEGDEDMSADEADNA